MPARTDPYQLTVLKPDGSRFSFAGTKKECETIGADYAKHVKGAEVQITKRK